jgi:hypothetical protein
MPPTHAKFRSDQSLCAESDDFAAFACVLSREPMTRRRAARAARRGRRRRLEARQSSLSPAPAGLFFAEANLDTAPMGRRYSSNYKSKWRQHLTPDLREHFRSVGVDLVRVDVANRNYRVPNKHEAALAWLEEQRVAQTATDRWRFWAILLVTFITALAAIWAVMATRSWDVDLLRSIGWWPRPN